MSAIPPAVLVRWNDRRRPSVRPQDVSTLRRADIPPDREALVCPRTVAAWADLSYHAVLRAIHRGELPASRLCGRIRIRPSDVERWIEEHRISQRGTNFPPSPLFSAAPHPERGSLASLRALERGDQRI